MGEVNHEYSWDSSKLDYFPKRRKWGGSLKSKGGGGGGGVETLNFIFCWSPELSHLSPHIFPRMAEQQPRWQVLCHQPPDYFLEKGSHTASRMGPVVNSPGYLGQEQTLSDCSHQEADNRFSFFCNLHFYTFKCENHALLSGGPNSGCGPDSALGCSLLTPVLEDADNPQNTKAQVAAGYARWGSRGHGPSTNSVTSSWTPGCLQQLVFAFFLVVVAAVVFFWYV